MDVEALSENPLLGRLPGVEHLAEHLEAVHFEPGQPVVREGELGRDMYFVLSGQAKILRADLEIGTVSQGDHFGELALLSAAPRAATLVAASELQLAKLSPQGLRELADAQPEVALSFVQALVAGIGGWLADMTQSVEILLRERALPRRTRVTVDLPGGPKVVRTGTALSELLPDRVEGEVVVAGLVDRRPTSLVSRVSSDCRVEPLTTGHWEGLRMYRDSVGLLLLEAGRRAYPHLRLRLDHSIGFAQVVAIEGQSELSCDAIATEVDAAMRHLVEADRPLREERWSIEDARRYFADDGCPGAAALLSSWNDADCPMVSYGVAYALRLGPLAPHTSLLAGFRVLPTSSGLLLVFGRPSEGAWPATEVVSAPPGQRLAEAAALVSQHTKTMMGEHHHWLEALGTTSVGELGRACVDGDVSQLIRVAEGYQEKRIGRIADAIQARGRGVKFVCIAGPSSSGKSTFIRRLRVQLQVNGLRPVNISLDNYYCNRDSTPTDESGELDFEAFDALRTDLLQEHLGRLLDGEEVTTAHYDFVRGLSEPGGGKTIALHDDNLIVLEGIHGLNPRLLASLPAESVFRVYLCPLAQLPIDRLSRVRASDVRLLRRIVRDRHGRGHRAADTIMRWPSVRRGERRHIFPFQHHADEVFDSSLIYELSVLKVFAERYLLEVPLGHPAYTTAYRLLRLFDRFIAIYPDHVPPNSILREFIGGSGFERV